MLISHDYAIMVLFVMSSFIFYGLGKFHAYQSYVENYEAKIANFEMRLKEAESKVQNMAEPTAD